MRLYYYILRFVWLFVRYKPVEVKRLGWGPQVIIKRYLFGFIPISPELSYVNWEMGVHVWTSSTIDQAEVYLVQKFRGEHNPYLWKEVDRDE